MVTFRKTWRFDLTFGLLAIALAGLGLRLAVLVRDDRPEMVAKADRQERLVVRLPGRIGSIYAATRGRGVLLAGSRQVPSCFVDPSLIDTKDLAETCEKVGQAIDADPYEIQMAILQRRDRQFAWLKREITSDQAQAVRDLGYRAVGIQYEWRREYPNDGLASSVVGFRLRDGRPGGGIELSMETFLRCQGGKRVMLADARRRAIWPIADECVAPRDGGSVHLCIDAMIQSSLERAVSGAADRYGARWAAGVVIDPYTGAVLALCSAPAFNPNEYSTADPNARTNKAVTAPYEPGSIFKPLITAAAVEAGIVSYDTVMPIGQYHGVYRAHRGGRISDHGKAYDDMTVEDGVVHSSNILMAKLGEMIGNRRLYRICRLYSFGERTGVRLSGESPGIVRPADRWDGYSLRRVPFGQEISTTSIQLAMAYSAICNGGYLMQPRLVSHVTDPSGQVAWRNNPRTIRHLLSEQTSRRSREVLAQVVERGTGKRCRLDQWTSFGKTGTAQIAGPGGYVEGAYVGSFVGGAPVDKPAVICLVSVYWPDRSKGYYGGTVAAPAVREVLKETLTYLGVPPDREPAGTVARGW